MKKLLRHLKAHLKTSDDWIVVYDNSGRFDRVIGDCILMDPNDITAASFLGVPVCREIVSLNEQIGNRRIYFRVSRKNLAKTIDRVWQVVLSCL